METLQMKPSAGLAAGGKARVDQVVRQMMATSSAGVERAGMY
jgi:hypothetical protein